MTVPEWWFNEIGVFTTYLLLILAAMYAVAYTAILLDTVKHWRKRK